MVNRKSYNSSNFLLKIKNPKSQIQNLQSLPALKLRQAGNIRLNKYIANAGICSRREADKLIEAGVIKVNGKVITQLGYKVNNNDQVKYKNKTAGRQPVLWQILKPEKLTYVLLNKPKDFITTTKDTQQRRTVLELVKNACRERNYPVGRLDRNTTGLLLLTNDGALAKKLAHPSGNVKKLYHVGLNNAISNKDIDTIVRGITLEDGPVKVDDIAVIDNDNKLLAVELHIGRNRIIRRIFEKLGYKVVKIDRVKYSGLTKKDLPRGKWRYLTNKEVIWLKYFK